jgi:uncharacterized membrane protein YoaK (UPF0700 family)
MKELKNILKLFAFALYALGAIGGTFFCISEGKWLFAIAVIAVAAMAFPFIMKLWPSKADAKKK